MNENIDNIKIGRKFTVGRIKELISPRTGYGGPESLREVPKSVERDLMKGSIDTHVHFHPDVKKRHRWSIIDTSERALEMGMKAVVFKCMLTPSAGQAWVVEQHINKLAVEKGLEPTRIFGAVTLNMTVGGLNTKLVKEIVTYPNLKMIWGPTYDAQAHRSEMGQEGGIVALTPNGEVREEIKEIIKIIASADEKVCLSVGHFSQVENIKIVEAGRDQGIDVIVDHPTQESTRMTINQMKQVTDLGGYISLHSLSCIPNLVIPIVDPYECVSIVKELGPKNIILASDQGHLVNPNPVDCFKEFITYMYASGIDKHQIEIMVKENPSKLLGI